MYLFLENGSIKVPILDFWLKKSQCLSACHGRKLSIALNSLSLSLRSVPALLLRRTEGA